MIHSSWLPHLLLYGTADELFAPPPGLLYWVPCKGGFASKMTIISIIVFFLKKWLYVKKILCQKIILSVSAEFLVGGMCGGVGMSAQSFFQITLAFCILPSIAFSSGGTRHPNTATGCSTGSTTTPRGYAILHRTRGRDGCLGKKKEKELKKMCRCHCGNHCLGNDGKSNEENGLSRWDGLSRVRHPKRRHSHSGHFKFPAGRGSSSDFLNLHWKFGAWNIRLYYILRDCVRCVVFFAVCFFEILNPPGWKLNKELILVLWGLSTPSPFFIFFGLFLNDFSYTRPV